MHRAVAGNVDCRVVSNSFTILCLLDFVVPSIYRGVEPKSEQQYEEEAVDPYSNLMRRYYVSFLRAIAGRISLAFM